MIAHRPHVDGFDLEHDGEDELYRGESEWGEELLSELISLLNGMSPADVLAFAYEQGKLKA